MAKKDERFIKVLNEGDVYKRQPLTLREKEFIELYEDAMNHQSKTGTRVKRQNKFPKRKKPPSTMSVMADGTRFVKDNFPLFPLIRGFSVYRT